MKLTPFLPWLIYASLAAGVLIMFSSAVDII